MRLSTYLVEHCDGADAMQPRQVVAVSRSSARMQVLRDLWETWGRGRADFADLRVRRIGGPRTSDRLRRVAEYRGVPHARAGDVVTVGGVRAEIVDADESANFVVLFLDGTLRGSTGHVHVGYIEWPARVAAACAGSQA